MNDREIDKIVKEVLEQISERARIEKIAHLVVERLGTERLLHGTLQGEVECPGIPDILSEEEAICEWEKSLPENATFDKDVDLNLIVNMYPLSSIEINGAIIRAYKLAVGQAPGIPVQRKSISPRKAIRIRDTDIRMGIVWAIGDRIILERIDKISKDKEREICKLEHWCKEHIKDYDCWRKEKKFEGKLSSFCMPTKETKGFKCPTNVGFDCNDIFGCFDGKDFIFDCNGEGKKKFDCGKKNAHFECSLDKQSRHTVKCWVGKDKDFDCKPIPNKKDEFICRPKSKDKVFKCPENVKFEYKKPPRPECPKHPHVEP